MIASTYSSYTMEKNYQLPYWDSMGLVLVMERCFTQAAAGSKHAGLHHAASPSHNTAAWVSELQSLLGA